MPVIRLVLPVLLSVIFLTFILLTVQFRPPYLPSTIVSLLVSVSALALLHWILTTARVKCAKKRILTCHSHVQDIENIFHCFEINGKFLNASS